MKKDNRTLDEIRQDDIDKFEQARKNAKFYDHFKTRKHAENFQRRCVDTALKRMGLPDSMKLDEKRLDRFFQTSGVRIENRTYPHDRDFWRRGIYIYKTDPENVTRSIMGKPVKVKGTLGKIVNMFSKWLGKEGAEELYDTVPEKEKEIMASVTIPTMMEEIDDLAYFISDVKFTAPSPFAINITQQKFGILTNVPVEQRSKLVSIPGMVINQGRMVNK